MNNDPEKLASAIRFLSIDAIKQANSGHPGAPMGMADIAGAISFLNQEKNMSQLEKWLNDEKIQYVEAVADWKEGLQIAGQPLLDEGAISQDYIDAIIRQKEEIGPYFVIAPRIAMPHARPEQGAKALGLSIVKLGKAVEFNSEENDPVEAIFMFAAPDSNSHIEMISQMAEVLSDEEIMNKIFAASSKEELKAILLADNNVSQ